MNSLLSLALASFFIVTVLSQVPKKGKCATPAGTSGVSQLNPEPLPLPSAAVSNIPQTAEGYRRRMKNRLRVKAWKKKVVKKFRTMRRKVMKKKH